MSSLPNNPSSFGFLLTNFVANTDGVRDALVVSADGIKLSVSAGLHPSTADQFAAITSGLSSLTAGAAACFGDRNVQRIMIEMEGSYLLIVNMSHGAILGVVAHKDGNIGSIAYEMTMFSDRASRALSPDLIVQLKNSLAEVR